MRILVLILLSCSVLVSCTTVDDYLLGKDNTPKPRDLKQIDSKVAIKRHWSTAVGTHNKSNDYLKLKSVNSQGIIYTATTDGVQAVRKKDGLVQWSTRMNEGLLSGPTLLKGYMAVATKDAHLVLLNPADGKVLWKAKVSGEILSPPTLARGKIIVKTIDGKVYVFDTKGKSLWTADHGAPDLVLKTSSSPVVAGNLVLIGFSDGKLDAYDLDNGRLMWQRSIAYAAGSSDVERLVDIDADPIVKGNVVYLASYQGYIGALSLTDGQFIWKKPASVYKNMLLKGNTLFVTDTNDVLWSIDSRTGHVNWKQVGLKSRGLTAPVAMKKQLVVGDKTGYVHIIAQDSGEMLGRIQVPGAINTPPSAVGKHLYVLTDKGLLNDFSVG